MSEFEANSCYSVNLKIQLIVTIGHLYCSYFYGCQVKACILLERIQFNAHAQLSATPVYVCGIWIWG